MTIAKSVVLFVLAAAAEIGGAWLVWQSVREGKDWWWAGLGVLALGAYGFVATLQPDAHFGRILAAYGGVFVAGSLAWGMIFDGFRPDRWDIIGSGGLPARRGRDHVCTTKRGLVRRCGLHRASRYARLERGVRETEAQQAASGLLEDRIHRHSRVIEQHVDVALDPLKGV